MRLRWLCSLRVIAGLAVAGPYLAPPLASAHELSRSLVMLEVKGDTLTGRLDVSLRDLEDAVGLDTNGDFVVSWGEVKARRKEVLRYVREHLRISADERDCAYAARQNAVDAHGGASYAVVELAGTCPGAAQRIELDYSLLFATDPAHRALFKIETKGGATTGVLSMQQASVAVELDEISRFKSFVQFLREGIAHIWHGYDHLAFLALLVLPAVLGHRGRRPPAGRTALVTLASIVTAFTVAHSFTLGLATFGLIRVPSAFVEVVIAGSVLVAAFMNLMPKAVPFGWRLAFGFGLVHGLGFANALGELGADTADRLIALGGFNIGVELGQLAVVAAGLGPLFLVRRRPAWGALLVPATSMGCAMLAVVWIGERF